MLSVDQALDQILGAVSPLPAVATELTDALGLVSAEDCVAPINLPAFTNAAMDGYAVRSADTADAARELHVVGGVAAGSPSQLSVGAGQALRIMTGAPLPDGADAVVRFEEMDESRLDYDGRVVVSRHIPTGENVRAVGEDLLAGVTAVQAGETIGVLQIGLLAALGRSELRVHRRPVVGILSTGDEVVQADDELLPGQVHDANAPMLDALVRQAGGIPRRLGVAGDSEADILRRLREVPPPDLLVTSGGVSVGDFDVVKRVLGAHGSIAMWQVRMKPGKPLAFGVLDGKPLLGLPGNPVAAFVSFLQFGRPLVRRLMGRRDLTLTEMRAELVEPVDASDRRQFVRGSVMFKDACARVTPVAARGSGDLSSAVRANCFIVIPEGTGRTAVGELVSVQFFDPV
jgi:molybdopterin molybdotransferase